MERHDNCEVHSPMSGASIFGRLNRSKKSSEDNSVGSGRVSNPSMLRQAINGSHAVSGNLQSFINAQDKSIFFGKHYRDPSKSP
jgi:hypothetical protein